MKRDLWGVSLWIWHYMLEMSLFRIKSNKKEGKNQNIVQNTEKILEKIEFLDLKG